jgi:citrate lyase subunit beta / citryl-CoA lyase
LRSLILAPADDAALLAAALASAADAVVVDLDVAPERREAARRAARRILMASRESAVGQALIARVSPLDSGETGADLDAIVALSPIALMLPGTLSAASVQQLAAKLAVAEARSGLGDGATAIIAVVDTAEGVLAAASLVRAGPRLIALAFDGRALALDLGVEAAHDAVGDWVGPIAHARDAILLAAGAARVSAVEMAPASTPDAAALGAIARAARRNGFAAMLAHDPDQAKVINAIFGAERKTLR